MRRDSKSCIRLKLKKIVNTCFYFLFLNRLEAVENRNIKVSSKSGSLAPKNQFTTQSFIRVCRLISRHIISKFSGDNRANAAPLLYNLHKILF